MRSTCTLNSKHACVLILSEMRRIARLCQNTIIVSSIKSVSLLKRFETCCMERPCLTLLFVFVCRACRHFIFDVSITCRDGDKSYDDDDDIQFMECSLITVAMFLVPTEEAYLC